jgi:hypothetical protein
MNLDGYIAVERGLVKRLVSTWRPLAASQFEPIKQAVAEANFEKARLLAADIDMGPVVSANKEFIRYSLFAAAMFGSKVAAQGKRTRSNPKRYDRLVNRATGLFFKTVSDAATSTVFRTAMQSIALAEETYRSVQKADVPRFVKEFVSFAQDGDAQLQLASALHTNRLAVWGFTAEAQVRKITTYELQAQLDDRTSAFCEAVNGRQFKVSDARDKVVEALSVASPEDLKEVQPWPPQDKESIAEVEGMSGDDLVERGWHIPPFHPYCRTLLVAVDDGVEAVEEDDTGEPTDEHDFIATPETFAELGQQVSEQDVDWWNTYVAANPTEVLASLSGKAPGDIIKNPSDVALRVRDDDVVFLAKSNVGEGTADVRQVFDPFTATLYQTNTAFAGASPAAAAGFLRRVFPGLRDEGRSLGASSLVVGASGAGGYALASMGFSTSFAEWTYLRDDILAKVEKGTLPLSDLSAAERQTVIDVLSSNDPTGLVVLADLPYTQDGQPIGLLLLRDRKFQAVLDLTDSDAMEQFEEYW